MARQHRYFFCLQPPVVVARRIGVLCEGLDHGNVATARLHLTLARTPDFPAPMPTAETQLRTLGASIDADPFAVSLDRVAGAEWGAALRPTRTPQALRALHRQLRRGLAVHGLAEEAAFNPHITLWFGGGRPFLRPVQAFAWEAAEVVLLHSVVGAAKHIELGRWPLARRQQSLAF